MRNAPTAVMPRRDRNGDVGRLSRNVKKYLVAFKNEIMPLNGENGTSLPVAFSRLYRAEPYNADGNGSTFVGVVQILKANLVVLGREASRG